MQLCNFKKTVSSSHQETNQKQQDNTRDKLNLIASYISMLFTHDLRDFKIVCNCCSEKRCSKCAFACTPIIHHTEISAHDSCTSQLQVTTASSATCPGITVSYKQTTGWLITPIRSSQSHTMTKFNLKAASFIYLLL